MIFVIGPLVKGAGDRGLWILKVGGYVGGMVVTASLFGALISMIGHPLLYQLNIAWFALGVGSILYGARELGLVRLPLPQSSWQVPSHWVRLGPFASPILYGAGIGVGILTRAPFASFHAMLAWQLVLGSVGMGVVMGFGYAVARASVPLIAGIKATDTSVGLIRTTLWIVERQRIWHLVNGLVLAVTGGILVVVAVG